MPPQVVPSIVRRRPLREPSSPPPPGAPGSGMFGAGIAEAPPRGEPRPPLRPSMPRIVARRPLEPIAFRREDIDPAPDGIDRRTGQPIEPDFRLVVVGELPRETSIAERAQDLGISVLKGAIGVPEAAVGLADLVSGGRAGQVLEDYFAFKPQEANAILDTYYSEGQQAAFERVSQAEGLVAKAAAALSHPSVLAQTVVESAPLMLGGAGVARGVLAAAPRVGALAAGAVGEGAVSAGAAAEQIRDESEDRRLTVEQSALAATSGVLTGALGVFGGKVARTLGIADVETLLAGASVDRAARKGLARQIVEGAVQEGFLEELPQSVQEQVLQNRATGRDLLEGIDDAAVMGTLAGAVMGGGTQAASRVIGRAVAPDGPETTPLTGQPAAPDAVPPRIVARRPAADAPPAPTVSDGLSEADPAAAPEAAGPEPLVDPRQQSVQARPVAVGEASAAPSVEPLPPREAMEGAYTPEVQREQMVDLASDPAIVARSREMARRAAEAGLATTVGREQAAQARVEAEAPREYASTQVNLPADVGAKVRELAARIPDEDLAADGREREPHATVQYGLDDESKIDALRDALATEPPVVVTFGKTSLFENEDADVVKIDIESDDLRRVRRRIAEIVDAPGDTHPDYVPHVTVAYVRPGEGGKYADDAALDGHTATIDRLTFSAKDGTRVEIPLGAQRPAPTVVGRRALPADEPKPSVHRVARLPDQPQPGARYEMPARAIVADPESLQFRAHAGREGLEASRAIAESYDPTKGGVLAVWRDPATGETKVVNGHHRLAAAQRNDDAVAVVFIDAATAKEARVHGALLNIDEDHADLRDAVQLMIDGGFTREDLTRLGVSPRSKVAREAEAVARLAPGIRASWQAGAISDTVAATIGRAELTPEQQEAVVKVVRQQDAKGRELPPSHIAILARRVKAAPTVAAPDTGQASIFEMLGEERGQNTFVERAATEDWLVSQLARDKRLFGGVTRQAGRLAEGGTQVDVATGQRIASESAQAAEIVRRLADAAGPISNALNRAAERIVRGEPVSPVRAVLLDQVRAAAQAELGRRPQSVPPDTGGEDPRAARVSDAPAGRVQPARDAPRVASPPPGAPGSRRREAAPPHPRTAPSQPEAEPQPFTAENLRDAFGLTKAQAVATVALAEAMGLDPSRIRVTTGGTPSEGALTQEDARREELRAFLEGPPIVTLTGNEFRPDGSPLSANVSLWYQRQGVEDVPLAGVGRVKLDARGVQNSVSHGLSRSKAIAFAALPDVIRHGRILHRGPWREGRVSSRGEAVVVGAPIQIGDTPHVAVALILADPNTKRLYVHEVFVREDIPRRRSRPGRSGREAEEPTGADAGFLSRIVEDLFAVKGEGPLYQDDQIDLLDTGERQARLPGDVGAVRETEVATPAVTEDAPAFRLTSEVATRTGVQGALFQGPKASVEFVDGGIALIRALEHPDVSSGIHELAHVARRFLFDRTVPVHQRAGITDADIETAERWAGVEDGVWTRESEETFARGFERYLLDRPAPPDRTLRSIFSKIATWLGDIYTTIAGSAVDVTISPTMRAVYGTLVARGTTVAKTPSDLLTEMHGPARTDEDMEPFRAAARVFNKARDDYRAGRISDAEYVAASKAFEQAQADDEARVRAPQPTPKIKARRKLTPTERILGEAPPLKKAAPRELFREGEQFRSAEAARAAAANAGRAVARVVSVRVSGGPPRWVVYVTPKDAPGGHGSDVPEGATPPVTTGTVPTARRSLFAPTETEALDPVTPEALDALRAVEFPELVALARELMATPQVVKRFRKEGKRGEFAAGKGIRLHADLFTAGHEQALAKTLAHEIGHLVDWLPDFTLKRGNILGHLQVLQRFLKHTFTATGGETIHRDDVRAELLDLSTLWRGEWADAPSSYQRYRKQSTELYADAVSVLLNNPGLLEAKAPIFYRQFFEHLDAKPEVKAAYFSLQELLSGTREELVERRLARDREMFAFGDTAAADLERLRQREARVSASDAYLRLRIQHVDKNSAVRDKSIALEQRGVWLNPDQDPRYLLEERNYLGSVQEAFVKGEIQPIHHALTTAGVTWPDLGQVLFYDRIIGGDRSDLANPNGLAKMSAEELRTAHLHGFSPEQRAVLTAQATAFRRALMEVQRQGYEAGLYTDEMWEQMQANPAYATYRVIEHFDQDVTARVHQQVGTLKWIQNPADATLLKMLATIRAAELQKLKVATWKMLEQHFPESIEQAQHRWNGRAVVPVEPKDPSTQVLIRYYENGKVRGKYVPPYIAESFQNNSIGYNNAIVAGLRWVNGHTFRPIFVQYNPGFQSFNFWRDFKGFYKKITKGVSPHGRMTVARTLQRYIQAMPVARARAFGLGPRPDAARRAAYAQVLEAQTAKIIGPTFNDMLSGRDVADTQIEEIFAKSGIEGVGGDPRARILPQAVRDLLTWVKKAGDFVETLPKAAAMFELKGEGSISEIPADKRSFIRRKVGMPDPLMRGTWTPVTNEVLLFSNIITQGWRADLEVATDPKSRLEFWWKTVAVDIVPKLAMAALVFADVGDGDDDESPGVARLRELQRAYRGISEYDRTNYFPVPIAFDGKDTTYLRLPQDESGRFFGGLSWKLIQLARGDKETLSTLAQVFDYTYGQFPGLTPTFGVIGDIAAVSSGRNVFDPFRTRFLFTDDELAARDWRTVKKFIGYEFQQIGGGVVWKFFPGEQPPREQTTGQKILDLPVVSNVVGRWIKISDYGHTERLRETRTGVEREEARARLTERSAVNEALREYTRLAPPRQTPREQERLARDIVAKLYPDARPADRKAKLRTVLRKLEMGAVRGQADPLVDAIMGSTSNAQRVAVILRARQDMSPPAFATWYSRAQRAGVVSETLHLLVREAIRAEPNASAGGTR